jgi:uncharacterized LabA/DUF88 family protein
MKEKSKKIGLFIDAENISYNLNEKILKIVSTYGKIKKKNLYANINRINGWENQAIDNRMNIIHCPTIIKGKSITDFKMIEDIMESCYEDKYQVYAICTSDTDFNLVVSFLLDKDKEVILFSKNIENNNNITHRYYLDQSHITSDLEYVKREKEKREEQSKKQSETNKLITSNNTNKLKEKKEVNDNLQKEKKELKESNENLQKNIKKLNEQNNYKLELEKINENNKKYFANLTKEIKEKIENEIMKFPQNIYLNDLKHMFNKAVKKEQNNFVSMHLELNELKTDSLCEKNKTNFIEKLKNDTLEMTNKLKVETNKVEEELEYTEQTYMAQNQFQEKINVMITEILSKTILKSMTSNKLLNLLKEKEKEKENSSFYFHNKVYGTSFVKYMKRNSVFNVKERKNKGIIQYTISLKN